MWTLVERGGLWVMIPLMGCSVLTVAFVLERALFWLRLRRSRDRERVEKFLELVDREEHDLAARLAQGSRDPVLEVLHSGLVHRNYDASSALEMAGAALVARAERFVAVLDTIVTLAPLLGILGTVVGIIQAFDFLSQAASVEDPQAVTGGIAKALITTATGLSIAILALIPHIWFRSRVERLRHEVEEAGTRLEILLRKRGCSGAGAAGAAGAPSEGAPAPASPGAQPGAQSGGGTS
jgi:biopolymer transport protein ExbB